MSAPHCALALAAALCVACAAVHAMPADVADLNRASALAWGWTSAGAPSASERVVLSLGISHRPEDLAAAKTLFGRVSDPDDALYTQYLTRGEVARLLPPVEASMAAAVQWLQDHNMEHAVTGTGDILRVATTVAAAEKALNVRIEAFTHAHAARPILRTVTPLAMPAALEGHVDFVHGLSTFPNLFHAKRVSGASNGAVTPKVIKDLYSITEVASPTTSNASQAVIEFQGQAYLPKDLAQFESQYSLPNQPVRRTIGPDATLDAGVESSLDIQYIIAAGTGVPSDFKLMAGNDFDLVGFAGEVLNDTKSALVWSVSYGEGVNGGVGGRIAVDYVHRLDVEFQKFALVGMSVLIASGDSGVYDRIPFQVLNFHPSFPSCLPSVTSVGATELTLAGVEDQGVGFSGGGFTPSKYFTKENATWQSDAVAAYFTNAPELPPQRWWDRNGRGLPDVSAVGVDFDVVTSGSTGGVSGTSASTPVVAGVFGLINDKLLAAGKKPLGFLNPLLYKNPEAFRDITKGFNNGGTLPFLPGFHATKGWDPVTGLGTPNYLKLKAAALAAQS